jgi:sialic acid synthase SpsE
VKCLYGNNNNNNERQKRLRRMGRGIYVENDIKKGEVGKDR